MSEAKLHYEDDRVRLVAWRNVGISVWIDAPHMEQLHRLRSLSERLHADYPAGFGFASVVLPGGRPNFSSEVRAESASIVRDTAPWGYGTAHIVLARGFVGVAVRSFLSTMLLLAKNDRPTKVFGELEHGATFLVERMGEAAPPVDELSAALSAACTGPPT